MRQQSGLLRDIGERAVSIVAVEHVLSPIRHEQIDAAIVVVVADRDALAPSGPSQSGGIGDIGECAVALVTVEAVWGLGGGAHQTRSAAGGNVEPTLTALIGPPDSPRGSSPPGSPRVVAALTRRAAPARAVS